MEGLVIFILLVAVIALLIGDSASSAAAPSVVIVQSTPTPRGVGCLSAVLVILMGLIVWALLVGG
jgi:hypothetical protein